MDYQDPWFALSPEGLQAIATVSIVVNFLLAWFIYERHRAHRTSLDWYRSVANDASTQAKRAIDDLVWLKKTHRANLRANIDATRSDVRHRIFYRPPMN